MKERNLCLGILICILLTIAGCGRAGGNQDDNPSSLSAKIWRESQLAAPENLKILDHTGESQSRSGYSLVFQCMPPPPWTKSLDQIKEDDIRATEFKKELLALKPMQFGKGFKTYHASIQKNGLDFMINAIESPSGEFYFSIRRMRDLNQPKK